MLTVVPITLGEAQRWIDEHHSHLDPPMRCILAVSIADDGRRCCVAVAEWPKAHHREGYVTAIADVLAVARDALLERGSIAEVLDLARTMALERVARGLPVAWVERTSESEWHAYVAEEDRRKGCWLVKRLSRRPGYGAYDFDTATSSAEDVVRRVTRAAGLLDTIAWEPATPAAPAPTSGHARFGELQRPRDRSRCAHPIDEEAFDDCHRGRLEKALLSAKRHLEATEPKNLPN